MVVVVWYGRICLSVCVIVVTNPTIWRRCQICGGSPVGSLAWRGRGGRGREGREGRRGEELIFMHLRVDPGTSRALIHQPCHLSRRLFWKCCFAGSVEGALGRIGRTCGTASKSTRRLPLPCGTSPGSAAASGSTWWSASSTPPGLGRWPVSCCRRSKQKRTGGRHEMGRNQLAGIVFEL